VGKCETFATFGSGGRLQSHLSLALGRRRSSSRRGRRGLLGLFGSGVGRRGLGGFLLGVGLGLVRLGLLLHQPQEGRSVSAERRNNESPRASTHQEPEGGLLTFSAAALAFAAASAASRASAASFSAASRAAFSAAAAASALALASAASFSALIFASAAVFSRAFSSSTLALAAAASSAALLSTCWRSRREQTIFK